MARYIDADKVLEMSYCPTPLTQDNPLADIKPVVDVEDIESIPSADVEEVKRGKWLKKSQRQKVNGSIIHRPCLVCSICERKHFALVSYNYCPNCGAKMEGGKK